ncbi:DUF3313 domain-containing protein [Crenobacter intestini]|uniref:DUF3313 domain-containing protein n=1 Tax=Crenobacter intestini TaxID=2563443 RepID=UPI001457EE68|nr:DUF3313 domain-containing protein [Crenobacter intestini]
MAYDVAMILLLEDPARNVIRTLSSIVNHPPSAMCGFWLKIILEYFSDQTLIKRDKRPRTAPPPYTPHGVHPMKIRSIAMAALLATTLAGCASTRGTRISEGSAVAEMPQAGFLTDYSRLQPQDRGTLQYLDRSASLKRYNKLMLEPVAVILSSNPEYSDNTLPPATQARIADGITAAMKKELGQDFQLVNTPGADVLRVRLALTGVQAVDPALTPADFIPVKAIFNAGRAMAGQSPRVAELTGEVEVLDANNRQLGAAIFSRKADTSLSQGVRLSWSDLEALSQAWAKQLHMLLLRGKNR